ncbi:MAG: hypothetical protein AMDU5_GPLC00005G0083, partial [Thermoplasmatales archaeon Gpl]
VAVPSLPDSQHTGWKIQRQGCSADTVKDQDVPNGKE